MIGNDVIDFPLAKAESDCKRNGWIGKIFTVSEQKLIAVSEDPEKMTWILWSMKESAYKIYSRENRFRAYIPLHLECEKLLFFDGNLSGKVRIGSHSYVTETSFDTESIHTTAAVSLDVLRNSSCFLSSQPVDFKAKYGIIKDEFGIPSIIEGNKIKPVSISHHGRFCSYMST